MFTIKPVEVTRVLSELKKIRAKVEQEVLDIYKGFILVAYDNVLRETPQWTGHAAAQWNIGLNHIDLSKNSLYAEANAAVGASVAGFSEDVHEPTKYKGDPEAIHSAKNRQQGNVDQIKLADIIFISNNVEDALNRAYAQKLEENPNNYLRRKNSPGHMVADTMTNFNTRLALLDEAARNRLRVVKLSDTGLMELF